MFFPKKPVGTGPEVSLFSGPESVPDPGPELVRNRPGAAVRGLRRRAPGRRGPRQDRRTSLRTVASVCVAPSRGTWQGRPPSGGVRPSTACIGDDSRTASGRLGGSAAKPWRRSRAAGTGRSGLEAGRGRAGNTSGRSRKPGTPAGGSRYAEGTRLVRTGPGQAGRAGRRRDHAGRTARGRQAGSGRLERTGAGAAAWASRRQGRGPGRWDKKGRSLRSALVTVVRQARLTSPGCA